MIYILKSPITIGNETLTELKFNRVLCAGDMRDMPAGMPTHGHLMTLAGRLTGVQDLFFAKMEAPDWLKVAEIVLGFMQGGPSTGGTP